MRFKRFLKSNSGYSLIELLVSMMIFGGLMIILSQTLFSAIKISQENYVRSVYRESVAEIFDLIKRDVRNSSTILTSDCKAGSNNKDCNTITLTQTLLDASTIDITWKKCGSKICKYEGTSTNPTKSTPDAVYVENIRFELVDDLGNTSSQGFSSNTVIITIQAASIRNDSDLAKAQSATLPLDIQQAVVSTRNLESPLFTTATFSIPSITPAVTVAPTATVIPTPTTPPSLAVCNFTQAVSQIWEVAGNWDCGHIPTASDDVVIDNNRTVYISAQTTIKSLRIGGTGSNNHLRFQYNAINQPLRIVGGDFILNAGGVARPQNDASALAIDVTNGNIVITGIIDADNRGYVGGDYITATINHINGYGPGGGIGVNPNTAQRGGGGGHGGNGGSWGGNAGGGTYGNQLNPITPGSGGGAGGHNGKAIGGFGGGVVKLNASGNITVTGSIRARGSAQLFFAGDPGSGGGSGSGGSIWITAGGNISGSGTINANGGDAPLYSGPLYQGGPGGGGRIAVYHSGSMTLPGSNITARAGVRTTTLQPIINLTDPNPPGLAGDGTVVINQL